MTGDSSNIWYNAPQPPLYAHDVFWFDSKQFDQIQCTLNVTGSQNISDGKIKVHDILNVLTVKWIL
jgi:hypothetical protein